MRVILLADVAGYRETMTWDEIRELMFKSPLFVHITDTNGVSVQLHRFAHSTGEILPLDDQPVDRHLVHVSSPIIVDARYAVLKMQIRTKGFRTNDVVLDMARLKKIKGESRRYVLPIELSTSLSRE